MKRIDLHIHSKASDGDLLPREIIDLAVKNGLSAIAITDHDTINGLQEAIDYAKNKIEFVPGIEISCREKDFDEVHVIGLFIDYNHKEIKKFIERIKNGRIEQKKKIIKKLNELGFAISFEEIEEFNASSVGRAHIARVIFRKYPNEFSSIGDVFDKYIGVGKPAYVPREDKIRVSEAIRIIKKSRGISFLCHPGMYEKEDALELIELFIKSGGQGIETVYPYSKIFAQKYNKKMEKEIINFFQKIAYEKNLLESGGSDFHGKIRNTKIGEPDISYELLEKIKNLNSLNNAK